MTINRKSMVKRRTGLFPSKPGVHARSTAFNEDDESSADVITGGYGNSRNTICTDKVQSHFKTNSLEAFNVHYGIFNENTATNSTFSVCLISTLFQGYPRPDTMPSSQNSSVTK